MAVSMGSLSLIDMGAEILSCPQGEGEVAVSYLIFPAVLFSGLSVLRPPLALSGESFLSGHWPHIRSWSQAHKPDGEKKCEGAGKVGWGQCVLVAPTRPLGLGLLRYPEAHVCLTWVTRGQLVLVADPWFVRGPKAARR